MACAWRGKHQRRPKLKDFILQFGEDGKITDPKAIEYIFRTMAQQSQARQKRAEDK